MTCNKNNIRKHLFPAWVGKMPKQWNKSKHSGNKMLNFVVNKFVKPSRPLREDVDMAIGRIPHMAKMLGHLSFLS